MAPEVTPKGDPSGCPTVVFAYSAAGGTAGAGGLYTTIGEARAVITSGPGSAGEATLLAKLPNGARITGVSGLISSNATTSTFFRLALFEVKAAGSAGTLSASVRAYLSPTLTAVAAGVSPDVNGLTPNHRISLSDDAAVNYAAVGLFGVTGATATISISFDLAFTYVVAAQSPT